MIEICPKCKKQMYISSKTESSNSNHIIFRCYNCKITKTFLKFF